MPFHILFKENDTEKKKKKKRLVIMDYQAIWSFDEAIIATEALDV